MATNKQQMTENNKEKCNVINGNNTLIITVTITVVV